jgi:glycosyltransferase involved in cell wall biosynthesis
MRIAFVTQIVPYPPHGGILQRGYNLLRELGREHHVDLIAFHHPDEIPPGEAVEESKAALRRLCASVEYFPLWPKRSAAHKAAALLAAWPSPLPFSVLAQRSAGVRRRLAALCASAAPPDIVHLDTIALSPYRDVCGSVPVVVTHHNIESQLMERRAEVETGILGRHYVALQARRLRRYEIEQSPRFPLNIMVSEADAAQLRALAPGARTVVVPNGVDTEYFQPRPGEETPAVIYTGGMNMFANRDGVEWFLDRIWPAVKAAVPGVRFFAIGQRPSPRVLEAVAADPAVEAPGFVPDIRPWVARSAVYIVPLRVGGGTRLKMVDAMAQGKAIVATRVGAEGIAGEDGRHFVLADDPDAFAARVVHLLRDEEARRRLAAAAREQVVRVYAWPLVGRTLAAAYAEVAEGAGAR